MGSDLASDGGVEDVLSFWGQQNVPQTLHLTLYSVTGHTNISFAVA